MNKIVVTLFVLLLCIFSYNAAAGPVASVIELSPEELNDLVKPDPTLPTVLHENRCVYVKNKERNVNVGKGGCFFLYRVLYEPDTKSVVFIGLNQSNAFSVTCLLFYGDDMKQTAMIITKSKQENGPLPGMSKDTIKTVPDRIECATSLQT